MRFCRREDIRSSRPDPATTANRIIVFAAFFDGIAGGYRAVNRSNRNLGELMLSLHSISHIGEQKRNQV